MSLAIVYTRAALGIEAPLITIEVHLSSGLPGLTMVGLPETTVKEARRTGYPQRLDQQRLRFPCEENNH